MSMLEKALSSISTGRSDSRKNEIKKALFFTHALIVQHCCLSPANKGRQRAPYHDGEANKLAHFIRLSLLTESKPPKSHNISMKIRKKKQPDHSNFHTCNEQETIPTVMPIKAITKSCIGLIPISAIPLMERNTSLSSMHLTAFHRSHTRLRSYCTATEPCS